MASIPFERIPKTTPVDLLAPTRSPTSAAPPRDDAFERQLRDADNSPEVAPPETDESQSGYDQRTAADADAPPDSTETTTPVGREETDEPPSEEVVKDAGEPEPTEEETSEAEIAGMPVDAQSVKQGPDEVAVGENAIEQEGGDGSQRGIPVDSSPTGAQTGVPTGETGQVEVVAWDADLDVEQVGETRHARDQQRPGALSQLETSGADPGELNLPKDVDVEEEAEARHANDQRQIGASSQITASGAGLGELNLPKEIDVERPQADAKVRKQTVQQRTDLPALRQFANSSAGSTDVDDGARATDDASARDSMGHRAAASPTNDAAGQEPAATGARLPQLLISRGAARSTSSRKTGQIDQTRFVHRVARAFEAARDRGGELRLRLNPPELGALRLEVKVQAGVLTARVEAETAVARSLLLDNLPVLRERLAEQGVRVEQFDVGLSDRHAGGAPDGRQNDSGREPEFSLHASDSQVETESGDESPRVQTRDDGGRLNVIV